MHSFPKRTIGVLLIGLSLFGACKSSEAVPSDRVNLGLNKSARVGADITVRVDTLSDSRCPINVNCFWEGIAFVSAIVTTSTDQQRVRLYLNSQTYRNRLDSTGVVLSGRHYKVILRDIYVAYPSNSQAEKQAVIQVTRL